MSIRNALLKCLGQALLDSVGANLSGDVIVDVLPEIVQAVWAIWGREFDDPQRRAELQEMIQAAPVEIATLSGRLANELAARHTTEIRSALASYLEEVPATLRQALRRPSDPSGNSFP